MVPLLYSECSQCILATVRIIAIAASNVCSAAAVASEEFVKSVTITDFWNSSQAPITSSCSYVSNIPGSHQPFPWRIVITVLQYYSVVATSNAGSKTF